MVERRRRNRRRRMTRNLYAYLNRRDMTSRGRRYNEGQYDEIEDWFDRNAAPGKLSEDET